MHQASPCNRFAGILLAIGGAIFFVAGILHPHSVGGSLRPSVISMLSNPMWSCAHWLAYTSIVLILLALWLLQNNDWTGRSILPMLGTRLTIIGCLFMMVEFAVELATRGAIGPIGTGQAVPMFHLFATMHAAGWPTLGAGFVLLVLGTPAVAPLPVRILGILGALAMGAAGVLVAGFYLTSFGWLFIGGEFLAIWVMWAGIQTARGPDHRGPQS